MPDHGRSRIGWIGAGAIGLAMLRRLTTAGHGVVCCDNDLDRQRHAAEAGARLAASPAEVASASDAIFLCLPNGEVVADVLFGRDGCAAGGLSGKLAIDTSSVDPVLTVELAGRVARETGGRLIDAPVSGGVSGAANGALVALVGGASEDIARARPWISAFASRIVHLGPVGSGQWAKLCNQAVICGTMALWTEAFALGQSGGIAPRKLLMALEDATADSTVRRTFGEALADGNFVTSTNLQKDIVTALARAGEDRREMIAAAARVLAMLRDRLN
jgi:3-hydroxyisobutyrate dehydrogenase-like beta-hydroxyacid dehydrogenase